MIANVNLPSAILTIATLLTASVPATAAEPTCQQFDAAAELNAIGQPNRFAKLSALTVLEALRLDAEMIAKGENRVITNKSAAEVFGEYVGRTCRDHPDMPLKQAVDIVYVAMALDADQLQKDEGSPSGTAGGLTNPDDTSPNEQNATRPDKQEDQIFATGILKVCWPGDFEVKERKKDISIPSGLIFRDWGRDVKEVGAKPEPDGPPVNLTVKLTQGGMLKTTKRCVRLKAEVISHPKDADPENVEPENPDAVGTGEVVKHLSPSDHRLLVSGGLTDAGHGYEPYLSGFAVTQFRSLIEGKE